jgi:hypothetical protein
VRSKAAKIQQLISWVWRGFIGFWNDLHMFSYALEKNLTKKGLAERSPFLA